MALSMFLFKHPVEIYLPTRALLTCIYVIHFQGRRPYLDILNKYLEIHATIANERQVRKQRNIFGDAQVEKAVKNSYKTILLVRYLKKGKGGNLTCLFLQIIVILYFAY